MAQASLWAEDWDRAIRGLAISCLSIDSNVHRFSSSRTNTTDAQHDTLTAVISPTRVFRLSSTTSQRRLELSQTTICKFPVSMAERVPDVESTLVWTSRLIASPCRRSTPVGNCLRRRSPTEIKTSPSPNHLSSPYPFRMSFQMPRDSSSFLGTNSKKALGEWRKIPTHT